MNRKTPNREFFLFLMFCVITSGFLGQSTPIRIYYPEKYNEMIDKNVKDCTTLLKNSLVNHPKQPYYRVRRFHMGIYSINGTKDFYVKTSDIKENNYIIKERMPDGTIESDPIVATYSNADEMFRDGWTLD